MRAKPWSQRNGVCIQLPDSYKCERHCALNYHLSTRVAFSQGVRRATMSLGGTDVGNCKVVTCVVGDMDRDLHGWAPPIDPTYVIEI